MSDVAPDVGRHAVLVDAGYLYASVGQLVLGRTTRREFRVSAEPLIGALLARADRTTPGQLLRMYWYDAARDRVPTVEQRQIAALPHVKVRLGNLNSAGQQKGVDAQLRQDLEVLARHRAVSDVVLVAGDEDMVPAVEAAQAYGVRVHVWGVEPPYGVNQAERLVWEADTVDQLDADFCRPYVEVEPVPVEAAVEQPEPREDRPAVPTPADVFAARKAPASGPVPVPPRPVAAAAPEQRPGPEQRSGPERPEMEAIGGRIAARWLLTRGRENVADLLPGPVLPTVIDKELLVEAEEEISRSLRPYEEARRALRDGFWARLQQEFGITATPSPPHATPASPQPASAQPAHASAPAASRAASPPPAAPEQAAPPHPTPPAAHPTPAAGSQPTPGAGSEPPPGSASEPGPAAGSQQIPAAGSQPTPIPGSQQIPAAGSQPTPLPGSQQIPAAGSQPTPLPGSQQIPAAGSHSTLGPGSQPTPGGSPQAAGAGNESAQGAGPHATTGAGLERTPSRLAPAAAANPDAPAPAPPSLGPRGSGRRGSGPDGRGPAGSGESDSDPPVPHPSANSAPART